MEPHSPHLVWMRPDGTSEEIALAGNQGLGIGRDPDNAIRPEGDLRVSRQHATIEPQGQGWKLVDAGSRHGTIHNGKPAVGSLPLRDGDAVRIGAQTFLFHLAGPAAPPPPAARPAVRAAPPAPAPRAAPGPELDESGIRIDPEFSRFASLYSRSVMDMKREIHQRVLERLNLASISHSEVERIRNSPEFRGVLDDVLLTVNHRLPKDLDDETFRQAMIHELVGHGPIDFLLAAEGVNDIMVNGLGDIFIERNGEMFNTRARFLNEKHLAEVIQRIVEPLGRQINISSPMVDARLPDGSRVNAIVPPLAVRGPALTIRKFDKGKLSPEELIKRGSMSRGMILLLEEAVRSRQNLIVSGGTGSGKTTLLNILSRFIPPNERLITIEDSAELLLNHPNLVSLEGRPPNIEGSGAVSIRDLMRNALRMRPNRIIVGECRGSEALDMLQAMNTGHEGSMTTLHANSVQDSLSRLETLVLMAELDLPSRAIKDQIASSIDLVVQQKRLEDGSRKVVEIAEVTGREENAITLLPIFEFVPEGYTEDHKVRGHFRPTGNIPTFVERLRREGKLRLDMSIFVPDR